MLMYMTRQDSSSSVSQILSLLRLLYCKMRFGTLIVSSPDSNFISVLHEKMEKLNDIIKIGAMRFKVDSFQRLYVKAPEDGPFTLITGTPIILRIPREKYEKYGIRQPLHYKYLYWRADHPLELFLSQLWDNLQRKCNEYFKIDVADRNLHCHIDPFNFFGELIFRKQISTKVFVKNTEQTVIGTTWEFLFDGLRHKEMIQFALDVGLGERNSMGFGFMNLKKKT